MDRGRNVHVVPHGDDWAVKIEGNERATRVTDTQEEAVNIARRIARDEQSELFIHARDGTIRERNTYHKDPYPPKG